MIQITPHMRIYLCIAPIDFRKGIDGLSRVCRNILDKDPFSGSMFIFRNKRKTTLKILVYDGQGSSPGHGLSGFAAGIGAKRLYKTSSPKGLGKNAKTKKVNRSFKAVWCYPLHRNFKELLNHG